MWKEFKYLYLDLAGAEIPYASWNPLTASKAEQNAAFNTLVAQPNRLGHLLGRIRGRQPYGYLDLQSWCLCRL